MKRSCSTAFYTTSNTVQQEHELVDEEASSTLSTYMQMQQHVVSERKRREKLNESFQSLRSLLPSGIKKDKASVLSATTDYLISLKSQVSEISKRNQTLEQHLLTQRTATQVAITDSSYQRFDIGTIYNGEESSSIEARRMIDLQVIRMGEACILDMVVSLLEFLKGHDQKMRLMSIEASTTLVDSSPVNRVILRLQIVGVKWEESDFQEALTRLLTQ